MSRRERSGDLSLERGFGDGKGRMQGESKKGERAAVQENKADAQCARRVEKDGEEEGKAEGKEVLEEEWCVCVCVLCR